MSSSASTSTRSRRAQYGLTSFVLILAVVVIVVVSNWLAVRKAPHLRFDWTATRAYTLSPQTRKILNALETDVTIVTLFAESVSPSAEALGRMTKFSELLDEYELRGGGKVTVEHIDPSVDADAFAAFAERFRERHADEVDPALNALDQAVALFDPIKAFAQTQSATFTRRVPTFTRLEPDQLQFLRQATSVLTQMTTTLDLDGRARELQQMTGHTLPDIEQATRAARQPLESLKAGLLTPAIERLQQLSESDTVAANVQDFAAGAARDFRTLLERIDAALTKLNAIDAADYNAARANVLESNSVVVMTDDQLTTIRLASVYTDPLVTEADQAAPEQRFRGEEAVTGAIISLTLQTPPLVVFINGMPQSAIRGTHRHVAERLTNMNFEVEEWNPAGRQTQYGPMPPGPKPEPDEGQPVVWVFLPPPPMNPMAPQQDATGPVLQALDEALAAGDAAMVFLAISPMSRFGQEDPFASALAPYGIEADTGKLIITSFMDQQGNRMPSRQHLVSRFESEHPIMQAMQGQTVTIELGLPLHVDDANDADLTIRPLLATPEDTWAEENFDDRQRMPEQNEGELAGPITVAAAVEKAGQRLIAIGDSDFASDQYILRTEMAITPDGLQTIERVQFAGNAELFVNGVYWLAGLDNLIATGARTQDVRRFEAVSPDQMRAVWWIVMAGVPAACLLAGGIVWLVRRK